MIQQGYWAACDFGGGDRVVQEYEQDLELRDLCDDHGIRLVEICFLGPEREDSGTSNSSCRPVVV
jgi:hypothetical protein